MSRMEIYRPWFVIRIMHEYYEGSIPVRLLPDRNTERFMKKNGLLFKSMGLNGWEVVRPEGEQSDRQIVLLQEEDFRFVFHLMPVDGIFHYATLASGAEVTGMENRFSIVREIAVWARLEIPFHSVPVESISRVDILLKAPYKTMEFVLVPKHTDPSAVIRLEEARGEIGFSAPEKSTFFGEVSHRVTAKKPVMLKENLPYRIRLWEVRDSGERLLADRLPLPRPDECSVFDPENTVTSYFYY